MYFSFHLNLKPSGGLFPLNLNICLCEVLADTVVTLEGTIYLFLAVQVKCNMLVRDYLLEMTVKSV